MKKTLILFLCSALSIILFAHTAFAVAPPSIDPVLSPFDGTKQTITGTTVPNARITVTGGPFHIPPINADANGDFSVIVSLTQDNTNIFQISATVEGDISDQVQVVIIESASQAAAAAQATGQDYSAPERPTIDPIEGAVDELWYTITGDAEPRTRIFVTGDYEIEAVTSVSGNFSAKVMLKQNQKNTFYIEAKDAAGNISPKLKVDIIEEGVVSSEPEPETETGTQNDTQENTTISEPVIAAPFSDISGHHQENYINTLRLQGVLQGYPDGTVQPDAYVNRAELLKMAMLSFGRSITADAQTSPFSDVPRFVWFARYVETGKLNGIISGYPDGSFKPAQTVNRAEAIKIILESAEAPYNNQPPALHLSTDIRTEHASEWYYKYMHFVKSTDIIFPDANGNLNPGQEMTRGDLAEIIVRLQYHLN